MKAIIIDDEYMARELLCGTLEKLFPKVDIIGKAENIDKAVILINEHQPQLVFLDIHMPSKSGFELFQIIKNINFEVIFVTSFSNYMIEAFKVSAIGYILKPIDPKELSIAVNNAFNRLKQRQFSERYLTFLHNKNNMGTDKMRIVLSSKEGYRFINITDIIRCEGWDKYTYIYTINGDKHLSTKNIGAYKQILESASFFTTHKSHIINPEFVSSYDSKQDKIVMKDNSLVPLARRRKLNFMALMK